MTIGIPSLIAIGPFAPFLQTEDADIARTFKKATAPAVTTLALEWLKQGHELVVFTQSTETQRLTVLKGERITIYIHPANTRLKRMLLPFMGTIFAIKKLFKLHKGKIDVISTHWTRDYAIASKAFWGKVPVFVTVRDIIPYIVKQYNLFKDWVWATIYLKNEWVMRQANFNFVANSQYTADMVMKYYRKEIPVIPNPLLSEYIDNISYKDRCDAGDGSKFVISTISISPIDDKRKNITTLLKAFKIVRGKKNNVLLQLIGPCFTESDPVVQEYTKQGLLDGIELLGQKSHDEIMQINFKSNLMVHPSLEETFGNTLIEAMACYCPVLGGKDAGAVPWVLDYGNAGYLCDVTSVDDIAEKMLWIIDNLDATQKLAMAGRKRVEELFSSRKVAQQYVDLFKAKLQ